MEDLEELYIRVHLGKTVEHPITASNLRMLYPDLNPDKLPQGFERFTRVPHPEISPFHRHARTEYVQTNYGWTDNHIIEEIDTSEMDIDPKDNPKNDYPSPPTDGEYFWVDSLGKWINYSVFEKVFGDFFMTNNIKYEDIDFETFVGLNDEQKETFNHLIEEYNRITNNY
jgi:hypothetical protein